MASLSSTARLPDPLPINLPLRFVSRVEADYSGHAGFQVGRVIALRKNR